MYCCRKELCRAGTQGAIRYLLLSIRQLHNQNTNFPRSIEVIEEIISNYMIVIADANKNSTIVNYNANVLEKNKIKILQ